jgi:hypothetical protein
LAIATGDIASSAAALSVMTEPQATPKDQPTGNPESKNPNP